MRASGLVLLLFRCCPLLGPLRAVSSPDYGVVEVALVVVPVSVGVPESTGVSPVAVSGVVVPVSGVELPVDVSGVEVEVVVSGVGVAVSGAAGDSTMTVRVEVAVPMSLVATYSTI